MRKPYRSCFVLFAQRNYDDKRIFLVSLIVILQKCDKKFEEMSRFLSYISRNIVQILAPPTEATVEEQIKKSWEIVSQIALENDENSLTDLHHALIDLSNNIKDSIDTDSEITIFNVLAEQQIPSNLVSYAISDNPIGFSDEVIFFFTQFTKEPLVQHLVSPIIFNSLNLLIENVVPHKIHEFNEFLKQVFYYLETDLKAIDRYIIKLDHSPLFEKLIFFIFQEKGENGLTLLSLLALARKHQGLENLLTKNEILFNSINSFVQESIITKTLDVQMHEFIDYIDESCEVMTDSIKSKFTESFKTAIVEKFLETASDNICLSHSIFLLASFNSVIILKPIIDHLIKSLPKCIKSNDENTQYLAFMCCTLMLEHTNPVISNKYQGRVTSNYMGLFNADWFVRTTVADILPHVRVSISKSFLSNHSIDWDITELMEAIIPIYKELIDLSDKVICSMLEFLSELGANKNPNISYYILSNECEGGLYDASRELYLTISRRIGRRPGTIDHIRKAYSLFEKENNNDGNENQEQYEDEDELFRHVIYVLEFFKELNSIEQVKNSFRMNETDVDSQDTY